MDYFIDAFRKYADFNGRATPTQFWMFILIYFIIYVVLLVLDIFLGVQLLSSVFSLVLLVPSLSIGARRLHDTGRTGWWQLIYLIPLIGLVVMIVFLVLSSDGDNDYGPSPSTGGEAGG